MPLNLYKNQPLSSKIPTFLFQKNIPRSARGITKIYTIVAMLYHRNRQYSKRQPIKKADVGPLAATSAFLNPNQFTKINFFD